MATATVYVAATLKRATIHVRYLPLGQFRALFELAKLTSRIMQKVLRKTAHLGDFELGLLRTATVVPAKLQPTSVISG